jgi:hypothetical protein
MYNRGNRTNKKNYFQEDVTQRTQLLEGEEKYEVKIVTKKMAFHDLKV